MRILQAAAAAAIALAGVGLVPSPATAGTTTAISITEGGRVVKSFPGMGPGFSTENETAEPNFCKTAPTCTVVPLQVNLPSDFDPEKNDFAVQIRLDWETTQLPNNQGQQNDLDLFVWDEPQGKEPLGRSVGTVVPEIVGLAQPQKGKYNIVVRNSFGNNVGYKLTVRWIDGRLVKPDESQEPTFTPFFESGETTQAGPTPSGSADGGSSSGAGFTTPRATPRTPRIPPPGSFGGGGFPSIVPEVPSSGGTAFGSTTGLDSEFGAGGQEDIRALLGAGGDAPTGGLELFKTRAAAAGPVEPPSSVLLWFWLAVVPLVLLGALALFVIRRRPTMLSFRVPTAPSAT